MIIIKILLVVAVLGLMIVLLRSYSARTRALTVIATFLFTIFAIAAIIFPAWTTRLANLIGVGRGADLLLYGLVVVVMFMIVNQSLHQRREERRFAKAIRQIALLTVATPESENRPSETNLSSLADESD